MDVPTRVTHQTFYPDSVADLVLSIVGETSPLENRPLSSKARKNPIYLTFNSVDDRYIV